MSKTVFISADHGLAIIYFLQTDVLPTLLDAGVDVVLLTDDALVEGIEARFGRPGLTIAGLRLDECRRYLAEERPTEQYWLNFLRRAGGSHRVNLGAVEAYREQVRFEARGLRRAVFPLMETVLKAVRSSRALRAGLVRRQARFNPRIYADLFDDYDPDLTVAATPGWRLDRYLLRESAARGVTNASVIVGWDNPSSYLIPGAPMDHVTCWSVIQKRELVLGSDWDPDRVHIGGIPSYDGYFNRAWLIPRDEYFRRHGLDPERRLIAYAASFITFSPNIQNIEALGRLVSGDELAEPAQLLVRLHPNHFLDVPRFAKELERTRELAAEYRHVHLVEPVPLLGRRPSANGGEDTAAGSGPRFYSGEDMDEKSSMMAHADVFTTVYSTMVVEAACHGTPIVAVTIDHPTGWDEPDKFYLPLSRIGHWPTHQRFIDSAAGRAATNIDELREALNTYLERPDADAETREQFLEDEVTYTDGSAGKRTGEYLVSLLKSQGLPKCQTT